MVWRRARDFYFETLLLSRRDFYSCGAEEKLKTGGSADVFLCSGAWKSVRGEQIDGGDILKIKVIIDSLQ